MTTLLPSEEQKIVRREYRARVYIIFLYFLFAASLCASVVLLPAYVTARIRKQRIAKDIALIEASDGRLDGEIKEAQKILKETSAKMALLETRVSGHPVVGAVSALFQAGSPGIVFTDISYTNRGSEGGAFTVSGIAATREELIALVKRLEREAAFTSVRLPVGNLALDKNSEFSITITGSF